MEIIKEKTERGSDDVPGTGKNNGFSKVNLTTLTEEFRGKNRSHKRNMNV